MVECPLTVGLVVTHGVPIELFLIRASAPQLVLKGCGIVANWKG